MRAPPPSRLIVVEDERAQRDVIARALSRRGHVVDAAASGEEALDLLSRGSYSLLVTDLRLPGIDGLALIRRAHELDDEIGLLLTTAYASVESAVEALRLGAHDYLLKPLILEELVTKAENLLSQRELARENARLRRMLQAREGGDEIVAVSPAMREVVAWVKRAAASRATVLITGESGTGKEVVARAIHRQGQVPDEPFLAVSLAAVPEGLVESELFGHERGAFTGAERRREGILRAASRGTVFLDEVAELPPSVQAKLLRAMEAREVQPLGSDRPVPFEARLLAATHRDLAAMVAAGRFREDLYYRLNVVAIHVPPLRERPEDVPALVGQLLARKGAPAASVTREALVTLCQHPWRGNVRELANVLERALILAEDGRIEVEHLPLDIRGSAGPGLGLEEAVARFERSHLSLVLRLCDGSRERAAEALGISAATLYRKLERLGLKRIDLARGARGSSPP